MAKKGSRKPNLSQETLARARAELYGTAPETPVAAPAAPGVPARVVRQPVLRSVDLRQEYAYVVKDLQKVAMLAGILLVLLIAASVVMTYVL
jgi:hypothetical protein